MNINIINCHDVIIIIKSYIVCSHYLFSEPDGPNGPDITHLKPRVIADILMQDNGRTGQNIYYCDLTSSPQLNETLLYKVEWWLTTSRRQGVLLKQTNFTAFTNVTDFNYITRLTESDLIANDVIYVGYTVSVKNIINLITIDKALTQIYEIVILRHTFCPIDLKIIM